MTISCKTNHSFSKEKGVVIMTSVMTMSCHHDNEPLSSGSWNPEVGLCFVLEKHKEKHTFVLDNVIVGATGCSKKATSPPSSHILLPLLEILKQTNKKGISAFGPYAGKSWNEAVAKSGMRGFGRCDPGCFFLLTECADTSTSFSLLPWKLPYWIFK